MNPLNPSTPSLAAAPEARPLWKGTSVLDTVRVAADTFSSLLFMQAEARKEFTRERVANADRPQKRTTAGVPLWSVKVAAVNWRGKTELISITVPLHDDPAGKFTAGEPVEFGGMVFGVTP